MNKRTDWSCLVDNKGNIFEWEDKRGAEYFAGLPQVVKYAHALLISKRDFLSFFYRHPQKTTWLEISFLRYKRTFNLVHAKEVTLPFEFSNRELEILTLVSAGLTNKEISAQLYISERTIEKHIEHLFKKTGIDSRTVLAVFAISKNLYCLPTPGNLESSVLATYKIEQIAKDLQAGSSKPVFAIKRSKSHPITIGVPYVAEGLGKIDAQELVNGSQLAVEIINQQGGINGRQLKLETTGFCIDDKKSILSAYQQLVEKEVDAISASYACYSPDIHEYVAQQQIPYLHFASHSYSNKIAQNLPIEQIDNIFQSCANDVNYGLGVLRFLQVYQQNYSQLIAQKQLLVITVKWKKVYIGIESLIISLKQLNWTVDIIELDQVENTFEYAIKQVHNLQPSMIVLASYFAEDIVDFYQAFIQAPINALIYSIYAPSAFLPEQQICEGVIWASTTGLTNNFVGQQFRKHYQTLFDRQPTYSQASAAYDQVQLLANVWRECVSSRSFKEVNQGIRSIVYNGVNGMYYLGNQQQIGLTYPDSSKDLSISQPHLAYQVQSGKSVVVFPDLFAESSFKIPAWFNLKA
ncbi:MULTISPECIES: LuxR C-terminal-related transcriptional regulator [Glaesserella]|uniref:Amino acid ABC transporter n=1 Tax=Glaesserella australis TaxID=2094024 RepID=A0A328BYR6_9PAST|nr:MULTISPECIES: LuxR C-terminal-related transcriptional regulator [Glaesserella]AUI66048.1 amino acid ABC transporter [Glaesserella sp. 15-184]RAL18232.1 amino acid ABC transporter [Glaesserella australis]